MNRCGNCGHLAEWSPEHCPGCGAYRTLLPLAPEEEPSTTFSVDANALDARLVRAVPTGYKAWDTALSGGVIARSSIVFYGSPGTRKSTWAGAIADRVSWSLRGRALYLCPEMPSEYVRDACKRVRSPLTNLSIIGAERDASNLDLCLREIATLRPRVVVWDSLQNFDAGGALSGSDLAVKLTVLSARRAAVRFGHVAILISQVNKAGLPSGPSKTIHDCDVVCRLEGEPAPRVTVTKSRFGVPPSATALPR